MTPIATFRHNRTQSLALSAVASGFIIIAFIIYSRSGGQQKTFIILCALLGAALFALNLAMLRQIAVFPDCIKIVSGMGLHTRRIFFNEVSRISFSQQPQSGTNTPFSSKGITWLAFHLSDGGQCRIAKSRVEHFEELVSLIAAHNAGKLGQPPDKTR